MRKNVASQIVGAQLIAKADGTAVTSGTTTVYVTGDGGTQAAGSVGSGACTHEGYGFWTYAPAQAETNYDHIAFTFVNTNAVNATVQVYTSYPQTGDAYARIGAPAGASIAADVAAVQSDTDNIQTRIPAALVSGRIDASVGAIASGAITSTAIASDAIGAAQMASSAIDEIADGLLDRDMSVGTDSGSATVRTVRQALRMLRNKWTLTGTALSVKKENDSTESWAATVTTDAAAVPIIGSDPASS